MDVGLVDGARGVGATTSARGSRRRGHSYRAATAWALAAVVLANAAIIVWLWARGGNVSSLHGAGDLLTSLGRITGLLGAYLALLQVLLLARLPPLERFVGFDRLTAWHRTNGKACLYLVLAHVVLTTVGYALNDRIGIPREVAALLTSYPGMIAATVGTALMILVVVTSLVVVRRRLRYEAWYLVHLTAYAGIALAWFHQVPTGNELSADVPASDYWNGLYAVTLALLLLFRLALPIVGAFRYRLRVAEVTIEGPGVVSLRITGRHLDRLRARAGQFFLWRFLSRRGRWWEAHPFSLSAAPDGRSLRITVKGSGDFTRRLGEIAPGTRVVAEGPFGVFTDAARRRERVALVAGGIGVTPIRALAEEMVGGAGGAGGAGGTDPDVAVIYRVLRDGDAVFRDEFDTFVRGRNARVFYVVGDHNDPAGGRLLSPEHLRELLPDIAEREVYICGPPAMMQAIERNVRRAGVPPRYIHTERFAL